VDRGRAALRGAAKGKQAGRLRPAPFGYSVLSLETTEGWAVMSYVQEVLQPEESVRFRSNVHWFVYLKAIVALAIAAALSVWYYVDGTENLFVLLGAIAFGVSAVVLAVPAWLKRLGTEVAVTNRRVIYKTGLIHRHTIEVNMDKVESVDVDQSIWGRLFGYGSITVRGTGEGIEPLRDIARPIELRNAVMVR
jgi:uncharacterized membrane protein YdbT with pleckstrin-like domain